MDDDHNRGQKGIEESTLLGKDLTFMPGTWGRLRLVRDDSPSRDTELSDQQ